MRSSRNHAAMKLRVGTLFTLALGIALLAMIFPTKGVNPFSKKIELTAYYPNVAGLRASSPVWFSGMEVGSVKKVDFVKGSNPATIRVVMEVEKRIQAYIKNDAQAQIKGMGLLGDMFVDITPGSSNAPMVANGAVLEGVPAKELAGDLDSMMVSAKSLLRNLDEISSDIANGQGSLGQLTKDPGLYHELREVLSQLHTFARTLNDNEGTAQKLMKDPELYDELVASVKDIRVVVADLKNAEQTLISPETKEKIDETVTTASRVVKRVGEYQEKIDRIRFDLSFGLNKYESNIAGGFAQMHIWPSDQRYYMLGIQKVTGLYGEETDQTTLEAQLAWRILQTPLYIRGGLIKDDYFVAGLDLRMMDDNFKVLLDAYRVDLNPLQLDARVGVVLMDLIELSAGAEDILRHPYYKAGLTIHYRDEDLINVLLKSVF